MRASGISRIRIGAIASRHSLAVASVQRLSSRGIVDEKQHGGTLRIAPDP
jgi:hypothetical protein